MKIYKVAAAIILLASASSAFSASAPTETCPTLADLKVTSLANLEPMTESQPGSGLFAARGKKKYNDENWSVAVFVEATKATDAINKVNLKGPALFSIPLADEGDMMCIEKVGEIVLGAEYSSENLQNSKAKLLSVASKALASRH
jgi:hypothetical protein